MGRGLSDIQKRILVLARKNHKVFPLRKLLVEADYKALREWWTGQLWICGGNSACSYLDEAALPDVQARKIPWRWMYECPCIRERGWKHLMDVSTNQILQELYG